MRPLSPISTCENWVNLLPPAKSESPGSLIWISPVHASIVRLQRTALIREDPASAVLLNRVAAVQTTLPAAPLSPASVHCLS